MDTVPLLILFALFHLGIPFSPDDGTANLKNCPPFSCGNLGMITAPFTNTTAPEECGPFVVDGCGSDEQQKIQLDRRSGKWYQLEGISQSSNTISITDAGFEKELLSKTCKSFNNLSLPNLTYASFIMPNLTVFKCGHVSNFNLSFGFKYNGCRNFNIYYTYRGGILPSLPPNCSIVQLPVRQPVVGSYDDLFGVLTAKFSVELSVSLDCYWCEMHGGTCRRIINGEFQCAGTENSNNKVKRAAVITASSAVIIMILVIIVLCFRKRFLPNNFSFYGKNRNKDFQSMETFLRSHGQSALKRYKYSEVKRMTNSFSDKLGQGGYGSVFKGKLADGSFVAVKLLKETKSNGEEFINEVASISRTSHVNIVTLLGFCFEGSKRALIYEFMSNGSLDQYIRKENPLESSNHLGWGRLYEIAVGIAKGLEYLHRGCKAKILHFDIKPNNVLLDEIFRPKISDFGLSKVCPREKSIISMLGARGTIGYIAPEVFCRSFGGVSHKSDIYSYGMLVLEMIGGRTNPCVTVDSCSEIYFPHWIFKRLELGDELGLPGISNEEDNHIVRKMVLVSLWCIQTDPSNRPPICRVLEMLQGSLESLPIPPKPYLSSPSRPTQRLYSNSSTISDC